MTERPSTSTLTFRVTAQDTAEALGSGELAVLGTPRLLAWSERATCAAVAAELGESQTSLGTRVTLEHLAASAVGEEVRITATVTHRDGRLLRFEVVALDSAETVVGHGEVTRIVVDRERFLSRLAR